MRLKRFILCSLLFLLITPLFAQTYLKVVNVHPPRGNVINDISLAVWNSAAQTLNIKYTVTHAKDLTTALQLLRKKEADIIVGPEEPNKSDKHIDYINTYVPNDIGVIIPLSKTSNLIHKFNHIISIFLGVAFSAFTVYVMLFALILWCVERNKNNGISKDFHKGFLTCIWFAIVTFSTVGYGDVVPKTPVGRVFTIIWIFSCIFLISAFIGSVSSELTVQQQKNESPTFYKEFIGNKKIAYLQGESKERHTIIAFNGIPYPVANIKQLFKVVAAKKVTAGFANEIELRSYFSVNNKENVHLVKSTVAQSTFAFIMRNNAVLENKVNKTLYEMSISGTTKNIVMQHIARQSKQKVAI